MKKLGKRFLIVLIIAGVGYALYLLFVMPSGYTDREQLTRDFITNIQDADACDTYFNPETIAHCNTIQTLFDGETVTISGLTSSPSTVTVTLSVSGNEETFTVYFDGEDVEGIKGFFNSVYYRIDRLE